MDYEPIFSARWMILTTLMLLSSATLSSRWPRLWSCPPARPRNLVHWSTIICRGWRRRRLRRCRLCLWAEYRIPMSPKISMDWSLILQVSTLPTRAISESRSRDLMKLYWGNISICMMKFLDLAKTYSKIISRLSDKLPFFSKSTQIATPTWPTRSLLHFAWKVEDSIWTQIISRWESKPDHNHGLHLQTRIFMSTLNNTIEFATLKPAKNNSFSSLIMKKKALTVLCSSTISSPASIISMIWIRERKWYLRSITSIETLIKGWEMRVDSGTSNRESDKSRRWLSAEYTEPIQYLCLGQKYVSVLLFSTSCKSDFKKKAPSGSPKTSTIKMIPQAKKKKRLQIKPRSLKRTYNKIFSLRKNIDKNMS